MWCCEGGGYGDPQTCQTGEKGEAGGPERAISQKTTWKELGKVQMHSFSTEQVPLPFLAYFL